MEDPSLQLKYVSCMIKNNHMPDEIAKTVSFWFYSISSLGKYARKSILAILEHNSNILHYLYGFYFFLQCGEHYNIDHMPILNCAKGKKGSQLLKKHGEKTNALNPPVSFIPTIEINGSQDLVPLSKILKDLKQSVCNLFKTRPVGCDN